MTEISNSQNNLCPLMGNTISNILFIHQGHELYGSDKSLLRNIRAVKQKYPAALISVITPQKGPLSDQLIEEFGIIPQYLNLGILRRYDLKRLNLRIIPRTITFFRHIKTLRQYDLVYINSMVVIDMIIATRFIKTRTIIHIREIPTGFPAMICSLLLSFSRAELVFISDAVRKSFFNLKNKKQTVLWNGTKAIPFSTPSKKTEYPIELLLIGRINHWKGQTMVIESVNLLSVDERNKIMIKIVGDVYGNQNTLKEKLINKITRYNLKDTVTLYPFTSEPETFYNSADVVVVPSLLPEPFGLVAIEAMSAGKPVIAANHGGLTEIVVHNETGILFEPGNPQALAEAISFAIKNPQTMHQMGVAGKQRYEQFFTEEIYIRNFQRIIV